MRPASLLVILSIGFFCGCASSRPAPDLATLDTALRERINHGIRIEGTETMPPGISIADGLTPDDAVAIALWNNPEFQVALTELGFAKADLVEAGQIRNPVLSLLFPLGPKQFEGTLTFAIDAIWQRPRRVEAAAFDADAVAARLMYSGLGVMAQARAAYLEATASDARARLAKSSAELWGRLRAIADARLREGDISEFEARSVRSEAAMADAVAQGAAGDIELARIQLDAILGQTLPAAFVLTPVDDLPSSQCGPLDTLLTEALAARPDVRAAEIAIEAAGARVGLEKSRIVTLTAALDANGEGKEGFELGPGLGFDIPLNGNAGPRARAAAGLVQAARRYLAVQSSVRAELRTGISRLARARDVLRVWDEQVVESLQIERQQAEKAYDAGETPLYAVLDTSRRLVTAQRSRLDARVELLAAAIALDRAIGRSCAFQ